MDGTVIRENLSGADPENSPCVGGKWGFSAGQF